MRFLKTKLIKIVSITLFICGGFFVLQSDAHAQIPDIEGQVLVAGTNAPIAGVWVRLTNSDAEEAGNDCAAGAVDQSRYALTDSSGRYVFKGWTQMTSAERDQQIDTQIDTNLDGSNDAIWFPGFSTCDATESHAQFSCGHDPFSIDVVRPDGWGGNFDQINKSKNPCVMCINNGDPTKEAEVIYYHGSGGGIPLPTPTNDPLATPTPPSVASCSINVPSSMNVFSGLTNWINPSVTKSGGTVDEVTFTVANASIASVCQSGTCPPGSSTFTDTPSFQSSITGHAANQSTTVTVTGRMLSEGVTCTPDTMTVNVVDGTGWFQTKESDVVTNGSISSNIPLSCSSNASCRDSLITYTNPSSPGLAVAGTGISTGNGDVSNTPPYGWNASSAYTGNTYSYDFFEKKAQCGTMREISSPIINSLSDLTVGAPSINGYYWIRYSGRVPLRIRNDLDLGNEKVILFVKDTDLEIEGDIILNNGKGLFMTIVGGNIIVDPSVGGPQENPAIPDLEGIFFAEKEFRTGTRGISQDEQLHIRGSVAAFDKISLQRSLVSNAITPAELFEFAPDLLMLFPSCLGEQSVDWRELAP